jgi:dolichyl-phosphate beta-glucosyltransferase
MPDEQNATVDISIVIPVYNGSRSLKAFLQRVISYCGGFPGSSEIIVVDDGSTNNTFGIAQSFKPSCPRLQVIRNKKNEGKGYSVRIGMLRARGRIALFLDADGSVDPGEIGRNLHFIRDDGYDIFIGSRVLRDSAQTLEVRWYRKAMGVVFNFFVRLFLFKNFSDTQCGFKMFRRSVVRPLFSRSSIKGFGFDIEILYLAHKMGYKITERPVSWRHINGSKVNLMADSFVMFLNILQVRNWHCTPINPLNENLGPDEYKYMFDLEQSHWWYVSRTSLVLNLIRSLRIASPVILDVGAGTGANLLEFGKLGKVAGVDISESAVEFCKRRGITDISRAPADSLPFGDGSFDIITCLDVLEHVPDPVKALIELKRVLKDNGRMIITVPAFKLLWSQHDEALCHLRRYDKKSLIDDLGEAGLKAERTSYFFLTSFFAVAAIRILRKFLYAKHLKSDTTTLPPKFLNSVLNALFRIEAKAAVRHGLPFGSSLFAVVTKTEYSCQIHPPGV